MKRLVNRFGKTGFAALSSLIWALPMAAWAGSADLSPIDKTAYPWVAFGVGALMLAVWLVMLFRLRRIESPAAPHRYEIGQMSAAEKRWTLALLAFGTGAVAWLNAAATVDWTPLAAAVGSGKPGPIAFAAALVVSLAAMLGGAWLSWRKSSAAFRARLASSRLA